MWIIFIDTKTLNWCMSSRREVFIRILALLQRKTLIETKNRTLKCLKRRYSTVPSEWKKVQCWRRTGHLPSFFVPTQGIWQLKSSHPREFAIQGKQNDNARRSARRGGGAGGWAQLESNWLMHYLREPGNDINRFLLHRVITRHGRR